MSTSRVLTIIIVGLVIIYVLRLFYLQVIRHDYYVSVAEKEQLKSLPIPAKRGLIYAMDNGTPVPLVMNETVYTVFADPQIIKERDEAKIVAALTEVAGGNLRDNIAALLKKKESRYQVLGTKLTRLQADKLKAKQADEQEGKSLGGIGFHAETQRVYPEGALAGQVLGFVNAEGKGNYGVEAALNDRLAGVDGKRRTVTDFRDVPLTIGDKNVLVPARDGETVVLSIDRNVQAQAEEALQRGIEKAGATKGSVMVMNPNTGKVLAMANYPSYAPADFSKVTDGALFNNAVISEPYEPASVIKTFTMATGIDKGIMTPGSTYVNTDSIRVDDAVIHNAALGHTGTITMQDVLNNSLNTGTVTIAQRLGDGRVITRQARDTMYDYFYNRFGLGQDTGIELANEAPGIVVSPEQQEGNAVRYANMTFGQGLDVTMVQVAAGFSSMINGGNYYKPTILAGTLGADGKFAATAAAVDHQTVSADTSAAMRQMTYAARQSVSYMRDADKPGYTVGGKTGTAETLKNGKYIKSETVGTYLGYGGTDAPKYVIMVQVSAPGKNLEGGIHASPIFTDISNWMIDYLRLPPKG